MPTPESSDPGSAARATRLREQIKNIDRGSAEPQGSDPKEDAKAPLTPRDFIRERMRDLDRPK